MADYQTGIDIRRDQSGNLIIPALLLDSAGAVVTSGDTTVYILEIQSDGTFKALDFSDNTFKSTALTTATKAATHQTTDNATKNTGIWTVVLDTDEQAAFTEEYHYIAYFENSGASPTMSPRWFQWGGVEGEATTDAELTAAHGDGSWETAEIDGWAFNLGTNPVTITLNDGDGSPVNGQFMVVRNADETAVAFIDITDVDGQCEIQLDDGTYKVRFGGYYACIAGGVGAYKFSNPYTLTVSGTTTATFTCTEVSLSTGGLSFAMMVGLLELFILNTFDEKLQNRFSRTLLKQLINIGHQELGQKLKWRREDCALAITADTYAYDVSLASREWEVVSWYDDSGEKYTLLQPLTLEQWREHYHDNDTPSTPTRYCRYGDQIYFWPVPDDSDDTCTITGIMDVSDLTEDDETPEYPPHLHTLIVDLAISYTYRIVGLPKDAAMTEELADRDIAREAHDPTIQRTSGRMLPPNV